MIMLKIMITMIKTEEKLEDTQRFTEQDRKKLVKNAKKDGRFKIMEVPLASK